MVEIELKFYVRGYDTAFLILCGFSRLHFIVTEGKTIGFLLKYYVVSLSSLAIVVRNPNCIAWNSLLYMYSS
jgi:hypothetical protein